MAAVEAVAPCKRALTPFTFNRGLQKANNISLVIYDKRATAVALRTARPTLFSLCHLTLPAAPKRMSRKKAGANDAFRSMAVALERSAQSGRAR